MTIEEKRDKLQEFCHIPGICNNCCLFGFGKECKFDIFTEKEVERAYNLAFGGEVKSDEIANHIKHGKWLICTDGYYPYCSECRNEPKSGIMTKYCPECGTRMDKE